MNFLDIFKKKPVFGTGALPDPTDLRDYSYDDIVGIGEPVDWNKGYDVEKELNIKIPFKSQGVSASCVGQGVSYYTAILNAVETKAYDEVSAKAIYSLIELGLAQGGAYIRDGMKLIVDYGALFEKIISSYNNGEPPSEAFMKDKTWKNPAMDLLAKILQAKEYRVINSIDSMEAFAMAIRDNYGIVGGVSGENNGTWSTNEPKAGKHVWGHCLYWGKFGTDELGRYIASPNSWGTRGSNDRLHPDGWQKFREDWFRNNNMFNPWTLVDKSNVIVTSAEAQAVAKRFEKKIIIEGEGHGRVGIIVDGKLKEVLPERKDDAAIYVLANNGLGTTVKTKTFDEIPKDSNF